MKLPAWFVGEFFGTFLLVFFGCGSVSAAVTTGAHVGVFQVAIVWGLPCFLPEGFSSLRGGSQRAFVCKLRH